MDPLEHATQMLPAWQPLTRLDQGTAPRIIHAHWWRKLRSTTVAILSIGDKPMVFILGEEMTSLWTTAGSFLTTSG